MNTAKSLLSLTLSLLAIVLTGYSVLSPTAAPARLLDVPADAPGPVSTELTVGPTDGILAPGSTAVVPLSVTHTGTVPARVRLVAVADDTALSRATIVSLQPAAGPCHTGRGGADQGAAPLLEASSDWVTVDPGQQVRWCAQLHLSPSAGNDAAGATMQLSWQAQTEQHA